MILGDTVLEKDPDLVKKMKVLEDQTLDEDMTMKVPHQDIQVLPDIIDIMTIEVKKWKIGEIIGEILPEETIILTDTLTDTTKVDAEIGAKKQHTIHNRPKLRWFSLLATLN